MKNIFIFISFISFALSLETITTFKIDGMMCGESCPKAVKKSLNNIEGINNCEVDFNSKTTTITYENEKIDKQQIAAIISEKTYFKITEKNEKSFWNWLFGKK